MGLVTVVLIPCGLVGMITMVAADDRAVAGVVTVLAGGFTAAMVGYFLWRLRPVAEGLRLATVGRPARARIDAMVGGADVESPVDRHGIDADDLRPEPSCQRNRQGGLAGGGRPGEEPAVVAERHAGLARRPCGPCYS